VPTNPVKGVKRPKVDSYEGKTPAIADKVARQLLNLPNDKSLRVCATERCSATLLYRGLRREELLSGRGSKVGGGGLGRGSNMGVTRLGCHNQDTAFTGRPVTQAVFWGSARLPPPIVRFVTANPHV
jgi:hypothetical protein